MSDQRPVNTADKRDAPSWARLLRHNPIPPLVDSGNPAIRYFTRRDLLTEDPGPVTDLWQCPDVRGLISRQHESGHWQYRGKKSSIPSAQDYDQLETYRSLGILVEKYGMTGIHPAISAAAEGLFSCQTEEGDFRGIYGTQYTPNYTGGILELLIKAGFADDERVDRTFGWLRRIRQDDGGWAIPLQTTGARFDQAVLDAPTLQPDPARPSSHLVTGCVLRAYAAHPRFRHSQEAHEAGALLAASLFRRGAYPGRDSIDFWTRLSFPFWFTDILSALDSLSQLCFADRHPDIHRAVHWLIDHQHTSGLWQTKLLRSRKRHDTALWVSFATSRVFRRMCQ